MLKDTYLSPPQLGVIGRLDGKHTRTECPKLSRTVYHNYKGFFRKVLLTMRDANYYFTLFDLGQFRSNNNSGVLASSQIGKMFEDELLHVPEDRKLKDSDTESLPYVLLGDETSPLKKWLMRPND